MVLFGLSTWLLYFSVIGGSKVLTSNAALNVEYGEDPGDALPAYNDHPTFDTDTAEDDDRHFDQDDDDFEDDDDPIYTFSEPTYYGSGCPADTVMVVPSIDEQTVSVLFSDYHVRTYKEELRERKSCNLAIPVKVKPGHSIGIFRVDYRGHAYVPDKSGSYAKFRAEYFFAGSRGPKIARTYKDFEDDLYVKNKVKALAWSDCGASTNFRINTSISASKRKEHHDDVEMTIDTTDVTVQKESYFKYYIKYKACD